MRLFATVALVSVLLTSPGVAAAQTTENENCRHGCYDEMSARFDYCNTRYSEGFGWWQIDRDYCQMEASQQAELCVANCDSSYPPIQPTSYSTDRFHPVTLSADQLLI